MKSRLLLAFSFKTKTLSKAAKQTAKASAIVITGMSMALFSMTIPAKAYSTSAIADKAETYSDGDAGGQCKGFVNSVVSAVAGVSLSGYQDGFAAKATEVTDPANAVRGDIIQITPAGSTDATAEALYDSSKSSMRLHTTIIRAARNSDGTFDLIDSNWGNNEKVMRHTINPYSWASGSIIKIWRFGDSTSSNLGEQGTKAPKDDFGIYRASGGTGRWYVKKNEGNTAAGLAVDGWAHGGQAGDIPFMADFNGDKIADLGIYRLVNGAGKWYVEDGVTHAQIPSLWGAPLGQAGDVPFAGDFDGDKKADLGVFRMVNGSGTWYVMSSATGNHTAIWGAVHGSPGDKPVVGDFNGDGYADFGIYRVTNGTGYWYVKSSANGQPISSAWGVQHGGWAQDVPIAGDFNGDGYADFGIYRPDGGTGKWYVRSGVNTGSMIINGAAQGGWAGDVPLTGNSG